MTLYTNKMCYSASFVTLKITLDCIIIILILLYYIKTHIDKNAFFDKIK